MAVWRVQELHKGRKGGLKEGMERAYTRVFRVRTNSKLDGPIEVMFAVDPDTGEAIPAIYSSYQSYSGEELDILALCRSVDPVQDEDDWTVWNVTCEYSTASITGDSRIGQPSDGGNPAQGSGSSNDPSLEPPVEEWSSWSREEAQERDVGDDTKMIATTAGEPFDPKPTREIGGHILVIERNELKFSAKEKKAFRYRINLDNFIFEDDRYQWLCKPITARRQYKGSLRYWRVRYEFWHCGDAETWDHRLLNAGYMYREDPTLPLKPIHINGQPPSRPWPLNEFGFKLTPGQIANNESIYVAFKKYLGVNFGPLAIAVDGV